MDDLEANQEEIEANQLAANWLLDAQALSNFVDRTTPYFSAKEIEDFAKSQNRHPGILVGRLKKDEIISYQNHNKFLIKVDEYLKNWIYP